MAYRHFAYVYDRLMDETPYPEWYRFAQTYWSENGSPRSVVDLGCGTGSIAIPLAQFGMAVVGIDLSADMLSVARDKEETVLRTSSYASGGSIVWLEQDMREWEYTAPVDAVISFCDSLNYLTEASDLSRVFRRTYQALRPGGTFLFDMLTAKQFEEYAEAAPFMLNEDDIAYLWTVDYDERRTEITHELTVFVLDDSTGQFARFDETHVQRAYSPEWVRRELAASGFTGIASYGDFRFVKADAETNRVFFAAKKPLADRDRT